MIFVGVTVTKWSTFELLRPFESTFTPNFIRKEGPIFLDASIVSSGVRPRT